MKTKINLGCGKDARRGYLNVDSEDLAGVDKVWNLNKYAWPFKDNSFDEALAFNILEHLDDAWTAFKEIHRICKPNALIKFIVPHFSSFSCWGDMQHKRGFTIHSFKIENMADKFEIIKIRMDFPIWWKRWLSWFANKYHGFYDTNLAYIFTCGDIHGELKVRK